MKKKLTKANLRKAYFDALTFFINNPAKWAKGTMQTNKPGVGDCHCLAGRMAVELGADRYEVDAFGRTVADAARRELSVDIIGTNDGSTNVADLYDRSSRAITPKVLATV
jgi:hypothetical protein